MPTKAKGKKSKSSAKNPTEKTAQQKKSLPKRPPAKTRSSAIESSTTAGTKRGRQAKSPGAPREKRSKTRPLTAADIPDIVSAVVKAMPQSAEASSTSSTPRKRSSRHKQRNTDQPSQATRRRVTGTTPTPETDDSSNEADTDNEVFDLPRSTHLNKLLNKAKKLQYHGLAKSSRNIYAAGRRRKVNFCKVARIQPIPTSECTLTLFISHLASSNISQGTIKVYLSAVRHMHVCKGLHNHFIRQITPRLHLILRGIKKRQAGIHSEKTRLPITIQMLYNIKTLLSKKPSSYYNTTLWAMCCLAFFGFLRVSEFTIPTEGSYDPSRHLSLNDIAVDNRKKPRLLLKRLNRIFCPL